jgi:hypothetical protein
MITDILQFARISTVFLIRMIALIFFVIFSPLGLTHDN